MRIIASIKISIYWLSVITLLFYANTVTLAQDKTAVENNPTKTISKKSPKDLASPTLNDKKSTNLSLYSVIQNLAKTQRLVVLFDFQTKPFAQSIEIDPLPADLVPLNAIKALLETYNLAFFPVDRRTIVITNTDKTSAYNPLFDLEEIVRKANAFEQLSKNTKLEPRVFKFRDFSFKDAPANVIINTIAEQERLNIIYDEQVVRLLEAKKANFMAKYVTAPSALAMFLFSQRLSYSHIGERTIMIRQAVSINHLPSSSLENIITWAEQNDALGIR